MTELPIEEKPRTLKEHIHFAISCTQQFRKIMEQETQALIAMDFKSALELGKTKRAFASTYADAIEALIPFSDQIKQMPQSEKQIFLQEKEHFDKAVLENKKELQRAQHTTKRLSERIIDVTRKILVRDGVNYGRNGMAKQAQLRPMHMSVNETL